MNALFVRSMLVSLMLLLSSQAVAMDKFVKATAAVAVSAASLWALKSYLTKSPSVAQQEQVSDEQVSKVKRSETASDELSHKSGDQAQPASHHGGNTRPVVDTARNEKIKLLIDLVEQSLIDKNSAQANERCQNILHNEKLFIRELDAMPACTREEEELLEPAIKETIHCYKGQVELAVFRYQSSIDLLQLLSTLPLSGKVPEDRADLTFQKSKALVEENCKICEELVSILLKYKKYFSAQLYLSREIGRLKALNQYEDTVFFASMNSVAEKASEQLREADEKIAQLGVKLS